MAKILTFSGLLVLAQTAMAQFNLYPYANPLRLGAALNISQECLQAMNTTILGCDPTLLQMASNFDNYWWEDDNLTSLCTGSCIQAVSNWSDALSDPCYGENVLAYGRVVPASSVSLRYVDGLNIACIPSWAEDNPPHPWCLTNSQEWVGSDIIRADCDANPSDPTCGGNASMISPDNTRMANLYSDDTLCDSCFVSMLYHRVLSIFLSDSDHSDYLVAQLQDIEDICSTQLPEVTVRNTRPFDVATVTVPFPASTTTGAPPAATTCAGQLVSTGSGCDSLSTTYGVTTGDLQALSGSTTCQISSAVCLPQACTLLTTAAGTTCDQVATRLNVTTVQFLSWNLNVMGLCDNLTAQQVCASAPGVKGRFTLPPPPLGTSADAGNQQRGGPGGVVTATTTVTGTANPVSGSANAPSPTQDGLASSCNNYAIAVSGDTCTGFATRNNISPAQLYAWNPVLGLNGANCTTNLWLAEYYCIGVWAATSVTAPGPTQTGISTACNKYAQVIANDTCGVFASRNSISTAQLFAWNSVLGNAGQNCATSLWTAEWYCVGVSASAAPATTTTPPKTTSATQVTAPGPTQTGIAAKCNKYAAAISGDSCTAFATRNNVTPANLYVWNTVLGTNGAACNTNLWTGEYYCIGVSS